MEIQMVNSHEHLRRVVATNALKRKLAMAEEMLNDFRANTSLGTIISEYEARVKEMERL